MNMMDKSSDKNFILPRWQFMYTRQNFCKFKNVHVFSKTNLLSVLSSSQTSSRTLVQYIFLEKKKPIVQKRNRKRKHTDSLLDIDKCINPKQSHTFKNDEDVSDAAKNSLVSNSKSKFLKVFRPCLSSSNDEQNLAVADLHLKKTNKASNSIEVLSPSMCAPEKETEKISLFIEMFNPYLTLPKTARKQQSRGIHIPKRFRKAIPVCQSILQHLKCHKIHYLFEVHCRILDMPNVIEPSAITNENLNIELKSYLQLYSSINEVKVLIYKTLQCFFSIGDRI